LKDGPSEVPHRELEVSFDPKHDEMSSTVARKCPVPIIKAISEEFEVTPPIETNRVMQSKGQRKENRLDFSQQ